MKNTKEIILDKRKAILDAASILFSRNGFHGTSTAEIAKSAGVGTGTVFNYFKTKEELINILYFEIKDHLTQSLMKKVDQELSIEDKLRRVLENFINWGLSYQNEYQFLNQFDSSPYVKKLTPDEVYMQFEFLFVILEKGHKEGLLKNVSLELVFYVLASLSRASVLFLLEHETIDNVSEVKEDLFKMMWDCIKK